MDGQIKKKAPKAAKVLALALAVLLLAGGGYWLWWRSLPPQRFATWSDSPPPELESTGISLAIDMMLRYEDGSADISLIMQNRTRETLWWGTHSIDYTPHISYLYKGEHHQIYPPPLLAERLSVTQLHKVEPQERDGMVLHLYPGALAMPGVYRVSVEGCGWVEFVILDDGKAFIGQPWKWLQQ